MRAQTKVFSFLCVAMVALLVVAMLWNGINPFAFDTSYWAAMSVPFAVAFCALLIMLLVLIVLSGPIAIGAILAGFVLVGWFFFEYTSTYHIIFPDSKSVIKRKSPEVTITSLRHTDGGSTLVKFTNHSNMLNQHVRFECVLRNTDGVVWKRVKKQVSGAFRPGETVERNIISRAVYRMDPMLDHTKTRCWVEEAEFLPNLETTYYVSVKQYDNDKRIHTFEVSNFGDYPVTNIQLTCFNKMHHVYEKVLIRGRENPDIRKQPIIQPGEKKLFDSLETRANVWSECVVVNARRVS